MDDKQLRKVSWFLMGAAACLQAASFFIYFSHGRYLVWFSVLLLGAGIFVHLKSKKYQPFKQWQLYIFTLLEIEIPIGTFFITLVVIRYLAGLPQEGEAVPKAEQRQSRRTVIATVIGGIVGLAAGFFAIAKLGEGLGDSPGLGMGLMCMVGATALMGAILGSAVGIPQDIRTGKEWKSRAAITGVMLVILSLLWYWQWQGVEAFRIKLLDNQAMYEMRNIKTSLEAYVVDNERYPDKFEDLSRSETTAEVQFEYKRIPGKSDGYELRAFHNKGIRIYMSRADRYEILYKYKSETDDKFRPM